MLRPLGRGGVVGAWGWLLLTAAAVAAKPFPPAGPLTARDTLQVGEETSADARECLAGLCWSPSEFEVRCDPGRPNRGEVLVRFPSPVPSGVESNDQVAMEWYVARDGDQQPVRARPVIVVHESGSNMTVGRIIARDLRQRGLHAFLIHLPYYGERRQPERRPQGEQILTVLRQAIADVRRARDAVAVLPWVDARHVALQGTSLGGMVAATTAGLDRGYDSVFLMLAGGDLATIIENGQRDAAKFREELERGGVTPEQLRDIARRIEPLRLAHRVDPARTWLYTADYDQVVPKRNSTLLADGMRLEPSHRISLAADHYTGIVFLPFVLQHMLQQIDAAASDAAGHE